MAVGILIRGLVAAAKAIQAAAKSPAFRRAGIRAAQKAGEVFSKTKAKATELCQTVERKASELWRNVISRSARRRGATRTATYGSSWRRSSLKDSVKKIVGDNPEISHQGSKTIYRNSKTGKEVIYDRGGNYFRARDTSIQSKRNFLDQDGNRIPNNKIENLANGRTRQVGKSYEEYQQESHFLNID